MMANEPHEYPDSQRIMTIHGNMIDWSRHRRSLHIAMAVLLLLLVLLLSWSEEKEMGTIVDEEPVILEDGAGFLMEDRVIVKDGGLISDPAN